MPWRWLYTARVTTQEGRVLELAVRAKNAADAERLTRSWAESIRPGPFTASVQLAPQVGNPGPVLRERFGRLTKPAVQVYEPGQVPPGALDYHHGVPIYREPPASIADIAGAEQRLGLRLPGGYREFLQWSNGGQTTGGIVFLATDRIFRLDEDTPVEHAHPWLLAVGVTDGGETLCLAPSEEVLMAHHDPPDLERLDSAFDSWLHRSAS